MTDDPIEAMLLAGKTMGALVKGAMESGLSFERSIRLAIEFISRTQSDNDKRRLLEGEFPPENG